MASGQSVRDRDLDRVRRRVLSALEGSPVSYRALAEAIGVSSSALWRALHGRLKRERAAGAVVAAAASALGLEADGARPAASSPAERLVAAAGAAGCVCELAELAERLAGLSAPARAGALAALGLGGKGFRN